MHFSKSSFKSVDLCLCPDMMANIEQTGAVIGLSIQAGFLTRQEGSVSNWANVQASLWFQFGWGILFAILFVALFRPGKKAAVAKSKEGERKDVGTVV